jgi:ribosomal subunit interface protein
MEVVVTGRHCEVSDRFREHVSEKLIRLEKHDHRIMRVQVEVELEKNPRQHDRSAKVELTAFSKGPVIRAEAAAEDKMGALDLALDKMQSQMRRAADRRRVHHGNRTPVSVATATAGLSMNGIAPEDAEAESEPTDSPEPPGPFVVREKAHEARPMTLDQALHEMELVGHDFYLFVDADSARPSVVYRRRGYDYGVIRLVTTGDATA